MENWVFWGVAGSMGLAVGAALIQALRTAPVAAAPAATQDLRVYRDQLAEIDRDLARGTLAEDEAARLRVEVSRRLLEADRAQAAAAPARARRHLAPAALLVALLLAAAFYGYRQLGAPGYADMPLAARLALSEKLHDTRPTQAEALAELGPPPAPDLSQVDPAFLDLMEKLRAAVKQRPAEPQGLDLLARNEAALGNLAAAEAAQRQLIAAKGDAATADDHATLAELMILQANSYVSPEAEQELIAALRLDPRNSVARYYSGQLFAQIGRPDQTFRLWKPLIDEGPADAPWMAPLLAQIAEVADLAGVAYTPPAADARGPDAADVEAAAGMSAEDRLTMIRGMVGQLNDRLASEGGPVEDWAKLVTSLSVLGEADQAAKIYAEAKTRFSADPAALQTLASAATQAGLAP